MANLYNKDKDFKDKDWNKDKDFNKDKDWNKTTTTTTFTAPTTTTTTAGAAPLMAGSTTTGLHQGDLQHGQFQHGQQFQQGGILKHHIADTDTRVAEQKLVLAEEKLVVGKREQEAGGIDIEKRVDRTTTNVPVTLEREVVSVERRPISGTGAITDAAGFGQQKEIVATVHADQAIATKKIAPVEQVRIDKHRVAEQKMEQAALRTENVEVKRDVRDVDAIRWAGNAGPAKVTTGNIVGPDGRVVAYEEQLAVGKERVAAGQVAVQKRVDTTTAAAPVTLESDEVHVTREPVSGTLSAPSTLVEGSAHIGLKKEVAQVGKVVVPKEEVVLRKGVQQEQHTVQAELAREHIQVKPSGAIEHRQGCSLKGCTDKSHLHDQEHLTHQSGFTGFSQPTSSTLQPGTAGFQQGGSGWQQQGTGFQQGLKDQSSSGLKQQGFTGATSQGLTSTTAQPDLTSTGNVRLHH